MSVSETVGRLDFQEKKAFKALFYRRYPLGRVRVDI
jgi:hypothetical protein